MSRTFIPSPDPKKTLQSQSDDVATKNHRFRGVSRGVWYEGAMKPAFFDGFWWFPGVSPMAFPIISYYISMNCSSTSPLSPHKPGSLAQAYILFPKHLEAPSWGWNPGWRWSRSSKFLHLLMTCPLQLTLCRLYVVLFFQDFTVEFWMMWDGFFDDFGRILGGFWRMLDGFSMIVRWIWMILNAFAWFFRWFWDNPFASICPNLKDSEFGDLSSHSVDKWIPLSQK